LSIYNKKAWILINHARYNVVAQRSPLYIEGGTRYILDFGMRNAD
jgi:hypothetical protein